MKKLLSILTISTLTASVPVPLLANTTLERTKSDVSTLSSNSNNDYLTLKELKNISGDIYIMTIDTKDNVYFSVIYGAFVLKRGETTPTKINGIDDSVYSISVDNKDNVYFGTNNGAYKLSAGSDTPTKINGINNVVKSIVVDSNDNIYFGTDSGAFVLKHGETTPTKIKGINSYIDSLAVDNNNNVYFSIFPDGGAFVLKRGETTPTKINGISNSIQSITIDSKDNIYFGMYQNGAFVLKRGETTPTKINGIETIRSIADIKFDSNDNIYFGTDDGAFVLKQGSTTPTKIDGISNSIQSITIDTKENIYFGTENYAYILQTALSWTKTQSQFTVESGKTQTWTRPDLITVDGELNIDIANPNIDKVVFDNVEQPQTSKQWKINVKPEIAPRDHNLQVMFTLDGKQYTSEIIVSMQAKIDPPTPSKQENLSELIKATDLGNIFDKNDDTIFSAVNQKNGNIIDDFSQIEIINKTDTQATLSAKPDSKSYQGSVDIKYNVVSATTVDLKIDVTPTSSSQAIVVKDYLGQIDDSNLTNPVNTFYYANSESIITLIKQTASSVIAGVVYGCDEQWNKTSQLSNIDPTSGIKLDGSQLNTKEGKYVVELSDNLGHTNNVYLQINKEKKDIKEYWNTDNGKQFEIWAKANGYDNIRGYSASQLNNLFADSKNWQQLASDSQFASAVADWFKINGKLSATEPLTKEQVIEQFKTQIPGDIKIDKLNTSNYDVNKVSFELNQSEFKPNDKVNITVKYNNASADSFTLQIKDSKTPDNNNKGKDSKLWIIGVVAGVLVVFGLAYLLFKRFVFDKYFLPKINKRRHDKLVEKVRKEEAEKDSQNNKGGEE
ncbi:ligand-binding sensor domain-containing protein [Spiroplasma phoeniceum]|uniref:Adhesion related protein, transmembrane n=1 Tax=Spiroplasma phoeniceum P40 TaxID=1276259 RepID=A0A345DSM2_9MOLU|nr:adhesin [Spiroplasma phoeniceum]AXF97213.1 hypothetical protein SDAV_003016 [Spiroplasma phoeniceum P40]